jgi:hypothetical protein
MKPSTAELQLGAAACLIALFLIFVGIPNGVSSPSNVQNIVLAPTFWPYVLSAITGFTGIGLLVTGWRNQHTTRIVEDARPGLPGWLRLLALGIIMMITMYALPRLGMVWTTMLVFAITALLFRTRHPLTAMVCAVLIPLVLYLFFAHIAGVGIPQGNYLRLP